MSHTILTEQQQEILALATLAYCANSPQAIMYALLKPQEGGVEAADLVREIRYLLAERISLSAVQHKYVERILRYHQYDKEDKAYKAFAQVLLRWVKRMKKIENLDSSELWIYLTQNNEYSIITPSSPYWPWQLEDLDQILGNTPPLCLWVKGDPQALTSCSSPVGIVGSRDCNEYGKTTAFNCGRDAALHGHCVISGGAMGADSAAHWGALSAFQDLGNNAGRTIAIFAGGLDTCGPHRNARLFQTIENHHGALISELPPDTLPESFRFLMRNRLIAALSRTLIVAQARHRSGALNTATWAADLNRMVYAAPGDNIKPYNTGCNGLIAQGKASLLLTSTDLSDICHEPHDPLISHD